MKSIFFFYKKAIIGCLISASFVGVGLWLFIRDNTPIEIPVHYSSEGAPFVTVSVEDQSCDCLLVFIKKYPLHLPHAPSSCPKEIDTAQWRDSTETWYEGPIVTVRKVLLGGISLRINQAVVSEDAEGMGSVGWPFREKSVLVDFPRNRLWSIPSPSALNKVGFHIDKMQSIAANINQKGVFFLVQTALGKKVFAIEPSCPYNLMKEPASVTIGDIAFDSSEFHSFPLPEALGVDGILGMSFLKKHAVYIDSKTQRLYVSGKFPNAIERASPAVKLPIRYTWNALPVMEVSIEGRRYPVKFDLGSDTELSLSAQSGVDFEQWPVLYETTSKNVLNTSFHQVVRRLPECRLGEARLRNLSIEEGKQPSVALSVRVPYEGDVDPEASGTMGYPLLHRTNIYCDFPHSTMWLVESEEALRREGVDLEEYVKVPFFLQGDHLYVICETDKGAVKMLLDTGASRSLIEPSLVEEEELSLDKLGNKRYVSAKSALEGVDFGEQGFYPFAMQGAFSFFDGVLGMDFLRKRPFYIDCANRSIYFLKVMK